MNSFSSCSCRPKLALLVISLLFVLGGCHKEPKEQSVQKVGTHEVTIIPGCREEEVISLRNEGVQPAYQFVCLGDQAAIRVVIVQDKELRINGQFYGMIEENDDVTIDHGKVLVNGRAFSSK